MPTMSPAPTPLPVILDGDPGHDDAINILLALSSPELEVLGLTTVFGNVGLERTTRNALVTREFSGLNVPAYAGADRPLVTGRISAGAVHGHSGLDGPHLPIPRRGTESGHAARFIIDSVRARPGEITVLPTGPLTNLALALRLAPDIAALIRRVVWMGGSTDTGNWTPAAEFNALADPDAAHIVFGAGVPLTMFGLNITHQAPPIAHPARVGAFRDLGTRTGEFVAALLVILRRTPPRALWLGRRRGCCARTCSSRAPCMWRSTWAGDPARPAPSRTSGMSPVSRGTWRS